MKSRIAVLLIGLAALALLAAAALPLLLASPRVIVLCRHAERQDQSADTLLSPAGEARARHLAEVLGELGVRAIYVTEYKRTQQTAQPLAQRLGLTPNVIGAQDSAALLQKLRRGPGTALVVGHSNTLPALLKALGILEPVAIPADEFRDLYVVVRHWPGRPTLLRLRY